MKDLTPDVVNDTGCAQIPLANAGLKLTEIESFSVWQNDEFRWVQEGEAIQSIMSRESPNELVLPTHRYMFVALAMAEFQSGAPTRLLNLGFGLGAIERKLAACSAKVRVTSVEASEAIVGIAKQYFFVDATAEVKVTSAEAFIAATNAKFDVVMIDLFAEATNAPCLYEREFYARLGQCVNDDAWLALNVIPRNEKDLLAMLLPLRENFASVAMATIPDRKNIVLLVGKSWAEEELPEIKTRVEKFGFDVRQLRDRFTLLPRANQLGHHQVIEKNNTNV